MPQNATATALEQYPLSPLQHGMLFHHVHSGRHTGVDIEQLEMRLREAIDAADMERAWATIAARHAVLRIPGNHSTLMLGANAELLVTTLSAAIDRVSQSRVELAARDSVLELEHG